MFDLGMYCFYTLMLFQESYMYTKDWLEKSWGHVCDWYLDEVMVYSNV